MGDQPVEVCEHKGVGHPDTLTDAVCETASRALSLAYRERYGRILHHNVDKGLLIAGKAVPRFGGGIILRPIRLIVSRAARRPDAAFDVADLVTQAAMQCVKATVRCDPAGFRVETAIEEDSSDLQQVVTRHEHRQRCLRGTGQKRAK